MKVGDEVVFIEHQFSRRLRSLTTVQYVTPAGFVRVAGHDKLFNPNGRERRGLRRGDYGPTYYVQTLTPEIRAEIVREQENREAVRIVQDLNLMIWSDLPDELFNQILGRLRLVRRSLEKVPPERA